MAVRVLAIDGPAGTGKSTTARLVARRLGWRHLDSGAFYRVAALLALRHQLDLAAESGRVRLREVLEAAELEQPVVGGRLHTLVDGEDVTAEIRLPAVDRTVSRVAQDAGLRDVVNQGLRARAGERPSVVDGRDIGSVVFPDAFLKVYLDASLRVRAERRAREAEPPERAGEDSVLASYEQSLAERDRADRERAVAPLKPAPDAIHLDTSDIDIDAQVARVVQLAVERGAEPIA